MIVDKVCLINNNIHLKLFIINFQNQQEKYQYKIIHFVN